MNKSDKIRWLKNEFKPTVHDLWDSHVYKNNPKKFQTAKGLSRLLDILIQREINVIPSHFIVGNIQAY